jgi:hypothetical protein
MGVVFFRLAPRNDFTARYIDIDPDVVDLSLVAVPMRCVDDDAARRYVVVKACQSIDPLVNGFFHGG